MGTEHEGGRFFTVVVFIPKVDDTAESMMGEVWEQEHTAEHCYHCSRHSIVRKRAGAGYQRAQVQVRQAGRSGRLEERLVSEEYFSLVI